MKIGSREFQDAEEAKHYVRTLLARYPIGSQVTDEADVAFLIALLERNAEYGAILSQGTPSFRVVRNRRKRATELEVLDTGGATSQVAWVRCLL